jgi:hypothetical protein
MGGGGTERKRQRTKGEATPFEAALAGLSEAIVEACSSQEEWPAKVGKGVYAGVEYLVADPDCARALLADTRAAAFDQGFRSVVLELEGLLAATVPAVAKPTPKTPAALMAGIVLLVRDYVRLDRLDRLRDLRPELHLMTLLPFLSFEQAQQWVEATQQRQPTS